MKNIIFITFAILFFGCNVFEQSNLEGIWVLRAGPKDSPHHVRKTYLNFESDSVFFINTGYEPPDSGIFNFNEKEEILILDLSNSRDTYKIYDFRQDSLTLVNVKDTIVFSKLRYFHQAKKEQKFEEVLTQHSFIIDDVDTVKFEFREDGTCFSSSFYYNLSWDAKTHWNYFIIRDELFFILNPQDDAFSIVFQVKSIKDTQIKLYNFYRDNNLVFKSQETKPQFNANLLKGRWQEIIDSSLSYIPPPPLNEDEKYLLAEELVVTDSLIYYHEFHLKDTIDWSINKENNIILTSNSKYFSNRRHWDWRWKIEKLTGKELILQRSYRGTGNRKELKIFKRIE